MLFRVKIWLFHDLSWVVNQIGPLVILSLIEQVNLQIHPFPVHFSDQPRIILLRNKSIKKINLMSAANS